MLYHSGSSDISQSQDATLTARPMATTYAAATPTRRRRKVLQRMRVNTVHSTSNEIARPTKNG